MFVISIKKIFDYSGNRLEKPEYEYFSYDKYAGFLVLAILLGTIFIMLKLLKLLNKLKRFIWKIYVFFIAVGKTMTGKA